jgi:hypothetical protein
MAGSSFGEQELALLRHIADRGAVSVAEAVEEFDEEMRVLDRRQSEESRAGRRVVSRLRTPISTPQREKRMYMIWRGE